MKAATVSVPPESGPVRWARSGVDVMDPIYERRAVRSYTDRRVEKERVLALIEAAISERSKELSLARLLPGTPLWEHRSKLSDPAFDVQSPLAGARLRTRGTASGGVGRWMLAPCKSEPESRRRAA